MKLKSLIILTLSLVMTSTTMSGQNNIKKAFTRFLDNPAVTYTENHSLSKDTSNGTKQSQSDVYNFTLKSGPISLINNIIQAFNKEKKNAYSVVGGVYKQGSPLISLAVGEDSGNGILLTTEQGINYQYALFLAPEKEDTSGNYRYAYAITWKETKGKITGSLIITYATTLDYRQSQKNSNTFNNTTFYYSSDDNKKTQKSTFKAGSWITKFLDETRKLSIHDLSDDYVVQKIVTEIYNTTKQIDKYPDVTPQEKEMARDILQDYINKTKGSISKRILRSAKENIK